MSDLLPPEALWELPIFPLPGTVLLPRTFISLHVFEPRYRAMMEDCIEGHRALAVALLDPSLPPDAHARPRIHPVAGVGLLRRSARMPDGRYNIVLEGLARADISDEYGPTKLYRRARARILPDIWTEDQVALSSAVASLRALCNNTLMKMNPDEHEIVEGLNQVKDPSHLADMVAAAAVQDPLERQRALAEPKVLERVEIVAGALGAALLSSGPVPAEEEKQPGWGIRPGQA